jgi:RNA polymerase sigma-70 factor (ECF subfamily)
MLPVPIYQLTAALLGVLALAMQEQEDDSGLAASIKAGDPKAFRDFYNRYYPALRAYLYRMGFDKEPAQDIIQQAFLYIWEHRQSIKPDKSLRAYIFRMAYTRGLNANRDNARFDTAETVAELPASAVDPHDETQYSLMQRQLGKCIQALPERRRQTFELCFLQELTYKEAADVMQVSVKTIENNMTAALKSIRDCMKSYL